MRLRPELDFRGVEKREKRGKGRDRRKKKLNGGEKGIDRLRPHCKTSCGAYEPTDLFIFSGYINEK